MDPWKADPRAAGQAMALGDPKAVSRYSVEGVLPFWCRIETMNIPLGLWHCYSFGMEILPSLWGTGKEVAGLGLVLSPKMESRMLASLLLYPHHPL